METLVRNVRDLDPADRDALERVLGHALAETQQVAVNVIDPQPEEAVPEWWKIYEGLSDEEIDELDQAIRQRADLTREFPEEGGAEARLPAESAPPAPPKVEAFIDAALNSGVEGLHDASIAVLEQYLLTQGA